MGRVCYESMNLKYYWNIFEFKGKELLEIFIFELEYIKITGSVINQIWVLLKIIVTSFE